MLCFYVTSMSPYSAHAYPIPLVRLSFSTQRQVATLTPTLAPGLISAQLKAHLLGYWCRVVPLSHSMRPRCGLLVACLPRIPLSL